MFRRREMAFDINKAAQPGHYYMKFINENCRPDGRSLHDIRPFDVELGCINTANGSSLVKLGSTTVLCGVKAQLVKPKSEQPNKGFIIPNVDLPPLCSSKFKPGLPCEQAQMLTQLMLDILYESKCVKEDDLCIRPGKLVWSLHIDMLCLNYDGNVQDACSISMISALKNTKLYEIEYDDEQEKPVFKLPFKFIPLTIYNEPICTTLFSLENMIFLCDPNNEEEEFVRTCLIICTLDEENICLIRKFGGFSIFDKQANLCIDRAIKNGDFVRNKLNNKLER
jgi:exosome complex component RRP43